MCRNIVVRAAALLFLIAFFVSGFSAAPVQAQDGAGGDPPVPPADGTVRPPVPGAIQDPIRQEWVMPASAAEMAPAFAGAGAAAYVGGPDSFGYIYDDGAAYNWYNPASGGTNAGLTGHDITGAIRLPFTFPFYENSYENVYISSHGYLTFTGSAQSVSQSRMGSPSQPNNLIAPYWVPTDYNLQNQPISVFYRTYGSAPNRTFVVLWNKLSDGFGTSYTFEVLLHEGGDITFQYNVMNYGDGGYSCATAGIEDARATDGLETLAFCYRQDSTRAVRFTRPGNAPRVLVNPLLFGRFVTPGQTVSIDIPLINTGTTAVDRYDIEYADLPGWPMTFTNAATGSALQDTNATAWGDTGPLAIGDTFLLNVSIQVPYMLNVGDAVDINFTVRSSLDANVVKNVTISLASPAPFATSYVDGEEHAVKMHLVEPGRQASLTVSSEYTNAFQPSLAETPNGNLFAFYSVGTCLGSPCVYVEQLEYSVHDRTGRSLKRAAVLASLSGSRDNTYDNNPTAAAAPNGTLGVVWTRKTYGASGSNANLYFRRVSEAGALLGQPVRVTAINTFNSTNIYNPIITATRDNRFVIAWRQVSNNVNDIYIAIYNAAGTRLVAPKKITLDTSSNSDGYWTPVITALDDGRVMIAYSDWSWECQYQVLNANGSVFKGQTLLSENYCSYPDLAQLSNGNILAAWESSTIPYALIDGNTYNVISTDNEFLAYLPGYDPSITPDSSGNGVITFMNEQAFSPARMFYAVVNDEGAVINQPMVMLSNPVSMYSGYAAYRDTTHTMLAQSDGVDLALSGLGSAVGPAESSVRVSVNVSNVGDESASNTVLTATIPPGLALMSSSITGNCNAGTCTWNLGEVGFMGRGVLILTLALPDAPRGTAFDVDFAIDCTESDAQPANNAKTVQVIIGEQTYSPYMVR